MDNVSPKSIVHALIDSVFCLIWNRYCMVMNNKCTLPTSQHIKMDNTSEFLSNCSELSNKDIATMNLAYSITAGVCGFISVFITLLLCICRVYKSVLQRLFLYMMVTTTVRELFL